MENNVENKNYLQGPDSKITITKDWNLFCHLKKIYLV